MFKKRKLHKAALSIARKRGMEYDYISARKHGLSPTEALEEFDMLDDEAKNFLTCAMAHSKEIRFMRLRALVLTGAALIGI